MEFLSNLSTKHFFLIAVLAILLVAIPATLYLVRQTQIFRPKALGEPSIIQVLDTSGGLVPSPGGVYQPSSSRVKFRLRYQP